MRDLPALDKLVDLVRNNKNKPFVPDDFERFGRELTERLREVGREALKEELRKADVDADSILLDGVAHRRVLRGTETYMTTWGPVKVERTRKRMRYFELKQLGLPIGSGPVEAACKTLVAQRMKQSGMRWGMTGGQSVLTVRGWSQSERFDHAWALLAAPIGFTSPSSTMS